MASMFTVRPVQLLNLLIHWDSNFNSISEIQPYLLPCALAAVQWTLLIRRSRFVYAVQTIALLLYGWSMYREPHLPSTTLPLATAILLVLLLWVFVEAGFTNRPEKSSVTSRNQPAIR